MVALIELLQKEKNVIRQIETIESLIQTRKEAIEWYQTNCSDSEFLSLVIGDCYEAITNFDKELHANQLILKAVRNEILAYFTSLKEEFK